MADKPTKLDTSKPARLSIAKMSAEERREISELVQKALNNHDLPKFQAGLAKLGYAETSAEYEKLMKLWDAFEQASRHD